MPKNKKSPQRPKTLRAENQRLFLITVWDTLACLVQDDNHSIAVLVALPDTVVAKVFETVHDGSEVTV